MPPDIALVAPETYLESNTKHSTFRQGLCSFNVSLSLALPREIEKALIHVTTPVGRESIHILVP